MRQSHLMLLNTLALYAKIAISAIVTLVSTRIALKALGVESFGVYNLIAGVISMLAFFNGALMVSAQRFLSYALGEKDDSKLKEIFKISFLVHLILALSIGVIFKLLQPFLFKGVLNIPSDLLLVSERVFGIMILSSIITIIVIPYNAAINAREEMWFFSISEIIISILKLGAAIALYYTPYDLLLTYTVLMLFAIGIGGTIKIVWCNLRYSETLINIRGKVNYSLFKEMMGFASWNTLGSLAMVMRNQGVAVVLNVFFGTVVNAAYGVANQLNALVITFASTLTTVFTPLIVKLKGAGNNERMLFVSIFSSKISFFLSSMIAIPVLLNTEFILRLWLGSVPEHTLGFSRAIIVTFLIMQLYPGITRALYADGRIKTYQIVISILLALNLPVGYFLFKLDYAPVSILITMVFFQAFTLIATVYFAGKQIELDKYKFYMGSVFKPIMIVIIIALLISVSIEKIIENDGYLYLVVSGILSIVLISISFYKLVFIEEERELVNSLLKDVINKIK